jgi:hypothetical protein
VRSPPPLLVDMVGLAELTSLSVRHLRRLDASGEIPGRVTCGRRVLFQSRLIKEWIQAGMPGRAEWPLALLPVVVASRRAS